jgi:hypothetical protein
VKDGLSLVGEAAGAIGHQAAALGSANPLTEVGFSGEAVVTLAALGGVQRDHMVPHRHRAHSGPHLDHHTRPFVAENGRKKPLRVRPGQGEGIGMADPGGFQLHQDFARAGTVQVKLDNFQGLGGFKGDGSTGLHGQAPGRALSSWGRGGKGTLEGAPG